MHAPIEPLYHSFDVRIRVGSDAAVPGKGRTERQLWTTLQMKTARRFVLTAGAILLFALVWNRIVQ